MPSQRIERGRIAVVANDREVLRLDRSQGPGETVHEVDVSVLALPQSERHVEGSARRGAVVRSRQAAARPRRVQLDGRWSRPDQADRRIPVIHHGDRSIRESCDPRRQVEGRIQRRSVVARGSAASGKGGDRSVSNDADARATRVGEEHVGPAHSHAKRGINLALAAGPSAKPAEYPFPAAVLTE